MGSRLFFQCLIGLFTAVALLAFSACAYSGEEATSELVTLYNRGSEHLLAGEYEEAVSLFSTVIEIEPRESAPYLSLSEAYYIALGGL